MAQYPILEEKERCEESLYRFLQGAWSSIDPSPFVGCWAIEAMCDHLEAVVMGHIKNLLINVPPRCAKTSLCSIAFPAWVWARRKTSYLSGPQVRFLCASYDHRLSLDSSNKSRRLIFSPWYQTHWPQRIILQPDQNTKTQYDNTHGGSRIATSVGGSLLGLGGDILIGDDLNKVANQAGEMSETDAERLSVAAFWSEFSSTRKNDPKRSALVVLQQRVHQEDVSGIILKAKEKGEEDWVHLCIPMRFDTARTYVTVKLPQYDSDEPYDDPREEEGELMWPERFGDAEVSKLERSLGPYMASGRLQQLPVPKGGGIIKRAWWRLWGPEEAAKYNLEWSGAHREFPHFDLVVGSLDTAYGEKEENDYNALTIWGFWTDKNKNRRVMLMYGWRKRLPLHGEVVSALPGENKAVFEKRKQDSWGLIEWIADTCKRYRVRRLLIEDKTRGKDVQNEIQRLYARENWGPELVPVAGDKVARTHAVVPLFTDGCVYAPDTRWAEMILTECELFPKDVHDDLHDTVTQLLLWARNNELLLRGDEMSAALTDEAAYRPPSKSVAQHYGV